MPKAFSIPANAVHLWVKQGKTDHMAVLEDPVVLSKLKERREKESASFALADLSILDLATGNVQIRWATTGQTDRVEAATIRFRDLDTEGRGSKRSSRRTTRTPSSSEAQIHALKPETRKRTRTRTLSGGSQQSNHTSKDSTVFSSIVTAESDTKESWTNAPESTSSSDDDDDDEDFDSSDDEAVVLRMKRQKRKRMKLKQRSFAAPKIRKKKEQKSDSSSEPTLVSGNIPGNKGTRKQNDTINGDRGHSQEFGVAPPDNGKTNMTNFLEMKRIFLKL